MWAETPCPETSHGAMNRLPVHPWSGYGSSRCRLDRVQIVRGGLACPSIGDNVESYLLSLVEDTHASAFDRADVHEDILAAIVRLDKAEALLVVEELHGSFGHITLLSGTCVMRPHVSQRSRFVRALEKSRSAEARSLPYGHFQLDHDGMVEEAVLAQRGENSEGRRASLPGKSV